MSKITQKQLIDQIKLLKEIKPRKEWAVLLKSQIIVGSVPEKIVKIQAQKASIIDVISSVFFQRKLAYSFAALVFLVVGFFGFANYTVPGDLLFPVKKIAEQSTAALTGHTGLKQNVEVLNNRINDLVLIAKEGRKDNIPSAIDEIKNNASELVKVLKENSENNQQALKDIAVSLKTLADVPGTDLSANPDVQDLYQAVVQSQIADLEKSTLTEDQQKTLDEAKDLYNQEKYTDALEKILLINE